MAQVEKPLTRVGGNAAAIVAMNCMLGLSPASGQDASGDVLKPTNQHSRAEPPLSMSLTPNLWASSLSGDVGVRGQLAADIDVDFKEIFEKFDWFPPSIMLAAEVRYDRFALLSDFIYLGLEAEGASSGLVPLTAEADLKTRSCLGDSAFNYYFVM